MATLDVDLDAAGHADFFFRAAGFLATVSKSPASGWCALGALGARLRPAAEGAYADGQLDGPWSTWWPDGTPRTRGEFLEGRRAGRWDCYHPGGQLAATGRYRLGLRDRKWVYLTPAGEKLEDESGFYRSATQLYPSRERQLLAEAKDGRPHGRWISWWSNGRVQLEGRYRDGQREGPWGFWLLDGSFEPELISGRYARGERVAEAGPEFELEPEPFALPEELGASPLLAPDPARLPRLARLPWVKPSQRAGFQEKIRRYLDDPDELQRRLAEQLLLQYGRDALPEVLNRLAELDLEAPADRARAERLVALLRGVCKGRGFALDGDPAHDRRAVVRWLSWFELARLQDDWWDSLRAGAAPRELLTVELVEGFARGGSLEDREDEGARGAEQAFEDGADEIRPRFSLLFRARQLGTRAREIRAPLERGLDWLAAHQGLDGGWDCDGFEVECARRNKQACGGSGLEPYDVGVTALALLAFLGDGNTAHAGEHHEVVLRGVRWLLAQQDPESGLIGGTAGHALTYNHALATLALCEVASCTDSPAVQVPARRAVERILEAQNPGAGWRYSLAPDGKSDTSVTGWMVQALCAARAAELPLADEALRDAFAGALAWIDAASDPESGRVGYDGRGTRSSRVEGINVHFPVESGEAMTAVGLFCRFLLGQDPARGVQLERHAALLLRALPVWAPEDYGCDLYYWAYGTEAMAQMGGAWWKAWRAALWSALLGSQRADAPDSCSGGSWDPLGPWGYAGGRVYSTALALLCLEGEFRHPRLAR